jgi:hypothetical protein
MMPVRTKSSRTARNDHCVVRCVDDQLIGPQSFECGNITFESSDARLVVERSDGSFLRRAVLRADVCPHGQARKKDHCQAGSRLHDPPSCTAVYAHAEHGVMIRDKLTIAA